MNFIDRSRLSLDYNWDLKEALPESPDGSPFSKDNGQHVLFVINHMFRNFNFWNDQKAIHKMEKLISKLKSTPLSFENVLVVLIKDMNDL